MSEVETQPDTKFTLLHLVALAWCGVAFIAQVTVVSTIVPGLPQRVRIYLPGRSDGGGSLAPGTADLVAICWVVIAVFTIAAIIALIFRPRAWSLGVAVMICALLPSVAACVIVCLRWQVGMTSPAASVPSDVASQVWLGFIVFFILGFGSPFFVTHWANKAAGNQA